MSQSSTSRVHYQKSLHAHEAVAIAVQGVDDGFNACEHPEQTQMMKLESPYFGPLAAIVITLCCVGPLLL